MSLADVFMVHACWRRAKMMLEVALLNRPTSLIVDVTKGTEKSPFATDSIMGQGRIGAVTCVDQSKDEYRSENEQPDQTPDRANHNGVQRTSAEAMKAARTSGRERGRAGRPSSRFRREQSRSQRRSHECRLPLKLRREQRPLQNLSDLISTIGMHFVPRRSKCVVGVVQPSSRPIGDSCCRCMADESEVR